MPPTTRNSFPRLSLLFLLTGILIVILCLVVACEVVSTYPQWHKAYLSQLLLKAVKRDDARQTEELLQQGANVNTHDEQNHPLLVLALTEGHEQTARVLLAFHPDVNDIGQSGSISALDGASGCNPTGHGSVDLVRILLEQGADVNAQSHFGTSALSQAAYSGNADIVSLLLKSGANPQLVNSRGESVIEEIRKHYDNATDQQKKARLHNVMILLNGVNTQGVQDRDRWGHP